MNYSTKTVHRGRLRGASIGASIAVAACEAVGIQHDAPGVRLRGFTFVGEPHETNGTPDVIFDLVVRRSGLDARTFDCRVKSFG